MSGVGVEAAGSRLPGQRVDRVGDVDGVAELVAQLRCLPGVGEGARGVTYPGPAGCRQGESRDQHTERAPLAREGQQVLGQGEHRSDVAEETGGQREGNDGAWVVTQRRSADIGDHPVNRSCEETASPRTAAASAWVKSLRSWW